MSNLQDQVLNGRKWAGAEIKIGTNLDEILIRGRAAAPSLPFFDGVEAEVKDEIDRRNTQRNRTKAREGMAKLRERKRAAGYKELNIFVKPEHEHAIKCFAEALEIGFILPVNSGRVS